MKKENPLQLDLFSIPVEENDQYICLKCGKKSFDCYPGNLCKECYEEPGKTSNIEAAAKFHRGTSASVENYVNKMLNLYETENVGHWYDLRDDDLIDDADVVGRCMACGEPVTKHDALQVNAFSYIWKHKDGHLFHAWECRGKHLKEYPKKKPGSMGPGYYYDFHKKYLELCGLTEAEYIENLRQNQPTVFKARQQGGQYKELCTTWNDAEKNDVGVFVKDSFMFSAGSRKDVYMELHAAKKFPYVYFSICYESAKDNNYGSYSPLCEENPFSKVSVFEEIYQIDAKITTAINAHVVENGNLCDASKERLLKISASVVEKTVIKMKEEKTEV